MYVYISGVVTGGMPTVVNKSISSPLPNLINVFCLPRCYVEDSETVSTSGGKCDQLIMSARNKDSGDTLTIDLPFLQLTELFKC